MVSDPAVPKITRRWARRPLQSDAQAGQTTADVNSRSGSWWVVGCRVVVVGLGWVMWSTRGRTSSRLRSSRRLKDMGVVAGPRRVDTQSIAELVNRRLFGPSALVSGGLVDSHAGVGSEYSEQDVKDFMRAAGLSEQDIDKLRWTSYKSGSVYPAASLLGNLLQYLVVPGIGVAFGSKAAVGASSVFVVAQILSAAVLQPAVITWSERIAKQRGPYVGGGQVEDQLQGVAGAGDSAGR